MKSVAIRIQQDNARPHVLEDDAEVNAAGCSDGWNITLRNQPAQSLDLNCLDLGVFASIQSLQSQTTPRTIPELIQEVENAFNKTSADTLNKTFLTLQHVMEHIMSSNGGNDYRLGHLHKNKLMRTDSLPTSLPCDARPLTNAPPCFPLQQVGTSLQPKSNQAPLKYLVRS
ncbi:unnamed protein product [Phytophthora fragariaefolia]|uniref:Unnamed protein product n=1 Tax=Phytophthora fragariaefolia TaxID=1490495 RepID=A0A9W7D011_9STRA|nr:unnamed protein product [Phytophthora fragariaefolia]